MPGAMKVMKRAKSIFHEADKPKARDAVCQIRKCSRFVLALAAIASLSGVFVQGAGANAVGLSLNISSSVHMKFKVISGVSDPGVAEISRKAAQPSYSANAVPSLRA